MNEIEEQGDPSPVDTSQPMTPPVRGWLLFFCIAFAIAQPALVIYSFFLPCETLVTVVHVCVLLAVLAGGLLTWIRSPYAFRALRIMLIVRGIHAFFQIYLGVRNMRDGAPSDLYLQNFTSSASNLASVLLIYFYFHRSTRVRATLGRNL